MSQQQELSNGVAQENLNAAPAADPAGQMIFPWMRKKTRVVSEFQELGFVSKAFLICSLPQTQPRNPDGSFVTKWKRQNGKFRLELIADPDFGLPYGRDRLLLHWLKTQCVIKKDPVIYFEDGASILEDMGFNPKGDNLIWLKGAINRLFRTSLALFEGNQFCGGKAQIEHIIKGMNSYYDKAFYDPNKRPFLVLSDLFFKLPGMPTDMRLKKQLGRAYHAMDLEDFLQYRLWYITRNVTKEQEAELSEWEPLRITLDEYKEQSGAPLDSLGKHFKQDIKLACKKLRDTGAEIQPKLVGNVIVTPIIRPKRVWTLKNQKTIAEQEKILKELYKSWEK